MKTGKRQYNPAPRLQSSSGPGISRRSSDWLQSSSGPVDTPLRLQSSSGPEAQEGTTPRLQTSSGPGVESTPYGIQLQPLNERHHFLTIKSVMPQREMAGSLGVLFMDVERRNVFSLWNWGHLKNREMGSERLLVSQCICIKRGWSNDSIRPKSAVDAPRALHQP
jgi:hypothetical protein